MPTLSYIKVLRNTGVKHIRLFNLRPKWMVLLNTGFNKCFYLQICLQIKTQKGCTLVQPFDYEAPEAGLEPATL